MSLVFMFCFFTFAFFFIFFCCLFFFFFFFSSRRRHTRWTGDWSSDVCSSDLPARRLSGARGGRLHRVAGGGRAAAGGQACDRGSPRPCRRRPARDRGARQIGRASCRERVEVSVVGVSVKKKKEERKKRERTST